MLLQHLLSGLATGAIYALMGLALVVIHQATHHLNLAQGEMATFTTFIAWQLIAWGLPYWPAFALTLVIAFALGAGLQRGVMHPLRNGSPFIQFAAMIALFLLINSISGAIWLHDIKSFPSPFPSGPAFGSNVISGQRLGMIAIAAFLVIALHVFLRRTRLGLALRATAENPTSARLAGIRVDRMVVFGWGLSAAIGAAAGMLIAPVVFLEPAMMFQVLPYAFAAAVVGGLSSPLGAVIGGLLIGIVETLTTIYAPQVGRELKLTVAFAVIVAILLVRPEGLFTRRIGARV